MRVIKIGGEVIADTGAARRLARALGELAGGVVVVHGGGAQASALQARMGLATTQVRGQRVTDEATLEVMKMSLAGTVAVDLQAAMRAEGVPALGLTGVDAALLRAVRRPVGPDGASLGLVGEIVGVHAALLRDLTGLGLVPCLGSLAAGDDGTVYNVNADVAARAVAVALKADALLLATPVGGLRRDVARPGTRIGRLTVAEARALIADGTASGGMIPKLEEAIGAVRAGVGAVHIVPALEPERWSDELASPGSVGTAIVGG